MTTEAQFQSDSPFVGCGLLMCGRGARMASSRGGLATEFARPPIYTFGILSGLLAIQKLRNSEKIFATRSRAGKLASMSVRVAD